MQSSWMMQAHHLSSRSLSQGKICSAAHSHRELMNHQCSSPHRKEGLGIASQVTTQVLVGDLLLLDGPRYVAVNDTLYQRTRAAVLSEANPYWIAGSAGEGVGGPHVGFGMIWPLSIITRGLTTTDPLEVRCT
jgi:meiotically up-regulated gene 157 (Mug157) protein